MQCPTCQVDVGDSHAFCSACGRKLEAPVEHNVSQSPSPLQDGERRQVTAMFADVVGSTSLAEQIGEEALYGVMQDIIREMSEAVQSHGGTIEKLTGDGLMALFGAPLAVEDAPISACAAGLDILDRIAVLGNRFMEADGKRLHVRIGINTGYAVVGSLGFGLQQEVTALGDSVNLAARLEGLAESDGLVIGETTQRLVADFMETEYAGERAVKGKARKQKIWHVRSARAGIRRFDASLRRGLTKLVGRERELESIQDAFHESQDSKTQIVSLCGDAGMGKSRLVHEFRQRLPAEGVFWLQGNCKARDTKVPFLPFIEVVRSSFGMSDTDPKSLVEKRLSHGVDVLGMDSTASVPYLMNLLGHQVTGSEFTKEHAEVAGIRTRKVLHQLLVARCHISSVVLHIDDLHWLDQASQTLLGQLIVDEPDLPLLMLFTHRPEYTPPWADAKEFNINGLRTIMLEPLSTNATEDLLRSLLGIQNLPRALVRLVLQKVEGNPLFVEEIVNYLGEREAVVDYSDDGMLALPVSLENLLMARVDRLNDASKSLLQAASVIGRIFPPDVAGEVAELGACRDSNILELQRMGLVLIDEHTGNCRFKHALIQDAVYSSLLTKRRECLHERTAQVLEDRHAQSIGEITEILAHHYSHTPRTEKAVRYIAEAGAKCLRVYSLDEADLHLCKAVELMEQVAGCAENTFFVDVLLQLARVKYFRADMYGLISLLKPHLARVEALDDPERLANFLFEIGYAQVFGGDAENGMALLKRSRTIAEGINDDLIIGKIAMGEIMYHTFYSDLVPEIRGRIEELEKIALTAGHSAKDVWVIAKTYTAMSVFGGISGNPKVSRDYSHRLFELTRETSDPRARGMGLWTLAASDTINWACEKAIDNAREGNRSALCQIDQLISQGALGGALGLLGRVDEALPLLQSFHDTLSERGLVVSLITMDLFLGPTLVMSGDMSRGIRISKECRVRNVKWGSSVGVAFADMVLGETYTQIACSAEKPPLSVMLQNFWFLLVTLPRVKQLARKYLERALDYFRSIDAPSNIAWALYDLALIDIKQHSKDDAREKLTEAFGFAQSVEADALADKITETLRAI